MTSRGHLSCVWTAHCLCGQHYTPPPLEVRLKRDAAALCRQAGWVNTRRKGWRCPGCGPPPRIVATRGTCGGAPRFEGTRLTVHTIADAVAAGDPVETVAAMYDISAEWVQSAVRYCADNPDPQEVTR